MVSITSNDVEAVKFVRALVGFGLTWTQSPFSIIVWNVADSKLSELLAWSVVVMSVSGQVLVVWVQFHRSKYQDRSYVRFMEFWNQEHSRGKSAIDQDEMHVVAR